MATSLAIKYALSVGNLWNKSEDKVTLICTQMTMIGLLQSALGIKRIGCCKITEN